MGVVDMGAVSAGDAGEVEEKFGVCEWSQRSASVGT